MGPGSGWDDRYWRMMQGWGCGLAWLLALGALVVLAAVLLRGRRPGAAADRGPGNVIEALDLRYARGEIDREDYLRRRADIVGRG